MEQETTAVRNGGGMERRAALSALCATAAFSFAAHGFLFANEFFSHDSVSYFTYATGTTAFYTGIGRFLIPLYETVKGDVAAPWLIGLLFIGWMTLAALLTADLLRIRSTGGRILTCGLLCMNLALTLTGATYIYCLDEYALALCAAAAAAWCFDRGRWWLLAGLGALVVSLAVYQPYFTVATALCLLTAMRRLTAGEGAGRVFRLGLRDLGLLAAGFVGYYGLWTALCALLNVAKSRVEESLMGTGLGGLLRLVLQANREYADRLLDTGGVLGCFLPIVHVLLLALLVWRLITLVRDEMLPVGNKVLLVVLVCLLPTALNAAAILMAGSDTQLMAFSGELIYLLAVTGLEPAARCRWARPLRAAAACLLCCVLWQHVVYANQVYMKKDLEKNATLALATRVLDRVETTEGYVPGETPVTFAGRLDENEYWNRGREAFADLEGTVGLWSDYAATYNLGRYLTDYLNAPLLWDTEADAASWPEVEAMPAFPAAGSVALVDGTVVVKLS